MRSLRSGSVVCDCDTVDRVLQVVLQVLLVQTPGWLSERIMLPASTYGAIATQTLLHQNCARSTFLSRPTP